MNTIYTTILFCCISTIMVSQCDPTVPFISVNLTGQPAGTYTSPPIVRNGHCCTASGPDRCVSFSITLDSQAIGLSFDVIDGAIPSGALYYQVNCGPQTLVGTAICLNGVGPHLLTFCKPGNNENIYAIQSIPSPITVGGITIRAGCSLDLQASGIVPATAVWNSIAPGILGDYNSYLSCTTGCLTPNVSIPLNTNLSYVDYHVCGVSTSPCNGGSNICDTVRVNIIPRLEVVFTPINPIVCPDQINTSVTAIPTGGTGNYTYLWSTGATTAGILVPPGVYNATITDGTNCPYTTGGVTVAAADPFTVSASNTGNYCAGETIELMAVSSTSILGYTWGSLLGFNSNLQNPTIPLSDATVSGTYWVTLTTSNGCTASTSTNLTVFALPIISITSNSPVCEGGSVQLVATGGQIYNWTGVAGFVAVGYAPDIDNVAVSNSGVYNVIGIDINGCTSNAWVNVSVAPCPEICGNGMDDDNDGQSDADDSDCPCDN